MVGLQKLTTYFRTDNADTGNGFSWFRGGVHNDNPDNPGTSGAELMRLTASGLTISGTLNPTSPATINAGTSVLCIRIRIKTSSPARTPAEKTPVERSTRSSVIYVATHPLPLAEGNLRG